MARRRGRTLLISGWLLCACLGALAAGGCYYDLEGKYDQKRCDPPCGGGEICLEGKCTLPDTGPVVDLGSDGALPDRAVDAPGVDLGIDQAVDQGIPNAPWAFSTGGSGDDYVRSVAVDSAGNSYVIGTFYGDGSLGTAEVVYGEYQEVFVAKLDKNGNVLWMTSAGGKNDDYGGAIAVDGSGNSYVTGYFAGTASFGTTSLTSKGHVDVFVAKLDSSGKFLWATSAGSSSADHGKGIAVDNAGNSYVTGSFSGTVSFGTTALTSKGGRDGFLAKLDSAGNFQWATSAGGPNDDVGEGVAVDSAGNSYVTGRYYGTVTSGTITLPSKGSWDAFVLKIDSAGNGLWATSLGGPAEDHGWGIAVDTAGNSHVTGAFQGSASFGTTTLTSKGGYDAFVAKLDSAGKVLWAASAGGPGGDEGQGITLDGAGNSHITGFFYGTAAFGTTTLTSKGGDDAFVAKLDGAGKIQWATSAGGPSDDRGRGIAVDTAGNSYAAGDFQATAAFGADSVTSKAAYDGFVAKLDSAGKVLWALPAGASEDEEAYAIAVDAAGNSYVTGSFTGAMSFGTTTFTTKVWRYDLFVAKLDSAGHALWATSATTSSWVGGYAIAVDSTGNSYITGDFCGTANFGTTTLTAKACDIFVAKLDSSGKFVWATSASGSSGEWGSSVALDGAGNLYVTGTFQGNTTFGATTLISNGSRDMFVAKLNSDGKILWATSAGGTGQDEGWGIAVDSSGDSHVTGPFQGTVNFGATNLTSNGSYDMFVAKLDPSGSVLWAKSAGGPAVDVGGGIVLDTMGNIHVRGVFSGTVSFGTTPPLTASGVREMFVAKLDSSGKFLWATSAGGTPDDQDVWNSVCVDSAGNTLITGCFKGTATFGGTELTSVNNSSDVIVAKLDPAGKIVSAYSAGGPGTDHGNGIGVDSAGNVYVAGGFNGTASFGASTLTSKGDYDIFVWRP